MLAPLLAVALDAAPLDAPVGTPQTNTSPPDAAPPAAAPPVGEILIALDALGGSSAWSGDPVTYGGLTLGLRLYQIFTPFAQGRLGYGRIDQRLLTLLSLGLCAGGYIGDRFYPRGFISFSHQHEESMASVDEEPGGAIFGVGAGIRHRAGVQLGAGFDIVLQRTPQYEVTAGPEISTLFMTYSTGPGFYGMIGLVAGGHVRFF